MTPSPAGHSCVSVRSCPTNSCPWFQGPAYPCGPCYCKTATVKYQFFITCFPGGELSFLIWALCSRSVFFPVLLRQQEEDIKLLPNWLVWLDTNRDICVGCPVAVIQEMFLVDFFHVWYGKVSPSQTYCAYRSIEESCWNAGSDSGGLGWGLRLSLQKVARVLVHRSKWRATLMCWTVEFQNGQE